ncbi:MAG: Sua5/YciO/YrdC/YwlC family protein [Paludibacteraceae bacterium]|nr:Sua5/YciO/YrdC/YwlC family protein [Paludibacteraceae bacterium]
MRYEREDIESALSVLRSGGVLVYPTDTVWGIGCDATNAAAVAKVYALKRRVDSKSMLVLVDSVARLERYVEVPDAAWQLLEAVSSDSTEETCMPEQRPLTIIYPGAHGLAPNLPAEDGSVGVRVTNEVFSQTLCRRLGRPIVSTSANVSGCPTARYYGEIAEEILAGADYVCRYRREDTTPHAPSSIIKVGSKNEITIIRP